MAEAGGGAGHRGVALAGLEQIRLKATRMGCCKNDLTDGPVRPGPLFRRSRGCASDELVDGLPVTTAPRPFRGLAVEAPIHCIALSRRQDPRGRRRWLAVYFAGTAVSILTFLGGTMGLGASVSFSPVVLFRRCFPVPSCAYLVGACRDRVSSKAPQCFPDERLDRCPAVDHRDHPCHGLAYLPSHRGRALSPGPFGGKAEKTSCCPG